MVRRFLKGYYPVATLVSKLFPKMDAELDTAGYTINSKEYISAAMFSFTFYIVFVLLCFSTVVALKFGTVELRTRLVALFFSFLFAFAVFFYSMIVPKWKSQRRQRLLDKDLLFAARHLMIQTSAGVPLFDAIVSVCEDVDDETLKYSESGGQYGETGKEFARIVLEVRSGKELTDALEQSAALSPSQNYRKVVWQLANANKTGARVGQVLRETVDFLAEEQLIMIRSYGAQLSTLALFYMLMCIIAPTMGLVVLSIGASIMPNLPINDFTFAVMIGLLIFIQLFFVGLIKNRRPVVSL
jgi:pilus assembly protein TadC